MRLWSALCATALCGAAATAQGARPVKSVGCLQAQIAGELEAGQPFSRLIGSGLRVYFQPIASGWILRILPSSGPDLRHDYAELATPPYRSVTPLSISTDFAFRAQDAVGWNPRRFHFAVTEAAFNRLQATYERMVQAGGSPPRALEEELDAELGRELADTREGTLTLVDSRLIPGTADQWQAAAAVASHFSTTAHTLAEEPDGRTTPLGRLLWVKFRLQLTLPSRFRLAPGVVSSPVACPFH